VWKKDCHESESYIYESPGNSPNNRELSRRKSFLFSNPIINDNCTSILPKATKKTLAKHCQASKGDWRARILGARAATLCWFKSFPFFDIITKENIEKPRNWLTARGERCSG
jgi:hypothetical protein